MTRKDFLLALLVVTTWGINFTVIRIGLNGVPPMLLAALRFILAAFPALLFIPRPRVGVKYWFMYGGTVGFGQFACLFYAMHIGMPAGLASVVLQAQAFFTLLFAVALLREKISTPQLLGITLAALGLFFITRGNSTNTMTALPPVALLLTLGGAACWGLSNIVVRKAAAAAKKEDNTLDMFSMVIWSSLIPPIPLALLSLALDGPELIMTTLSNIDTTSLFALGYLAFLSTLFGYGAWSKLLSKYPASQVAPLSLLVPVTGLLTASLVLGERLSANQWLGCGLVLGGLMVTIFGFTLVRRLTSVSN
jgi:O-acetylserine/cysteine efflux transporter